LEKTMNAFAAKVEENLLMHVSIMGSFFEKNVQKKWNLRRT